VHLAHARHRDRGCVRALADARVLERLDVDDDVAARKRALDRRLDRVRGGMALSDAGARRHADHDVGEVAAAGLPHAQPPQRDLRQRRDRGARGLLGRHGSAVHQHVDVAAREPRRRDQHEDGDEERGHGVAVRVARSCEHEPREDGRRAREVAREMERVRGERGASVRARRAEGDERTAGVERDDDADDDERVPGGVDRVRRRAGQPLDGAEAD